jgi:hypothetical protein
MQAFVDEQLALKEKQKDTTTDVVSNKASENIEVIAKAEIAVDAKAGTKE